MFTLVIEPLVSWLAAWDRSYKFQTSNQRVSPVVFAGNIVVFASTYEHLAIQARKITAFLDWAGLEANLDHKWRNKRGISSPTFNRESGHQTLILIASKEVPRIQPGEAYVYLEQATSLHHHKSLHRENIHELLSKMREQIIHTTLGLELQMLGQVSRPHIQYTMPTAPIHVRGHE